MAIKLTKNELKNQKESLKMYRRYLPTLQLKKQQLQTEIRTIEARAKEVRLHRDALNQEFEDWVAVFGEQNVFKPSMVKIKEILTSTGNIAGVSIPVFSGAEFERAKYDLYKTPLWVDTAAEKMQEVLSLDLEAKVLDEQVRLLNSELRTTTQRVNLFEKVKIPETRANIKKITVYLGDQQVAAVVRGKISKKNLEKVHDKDEAL
ncbi:V-type ATP synthase subunit D [Treponema sp. OMZ 792]|uniref:V-type ATP synthase subunit D n=1 Tax=unclassified Treponema TaxID=2638727 RepID=UPI0020A295D4|nr:MULTISPECIES: V-type ATP synthase subunit D [unclassified Treponema]UTC67979.1 V-type ATP synthase subunit D [Treponema sp. OMZ 789]UTC70702.1 V-type ATP synthase subunit D [Treponema sp. OMZ 790]UTC73423.1 V-type ATP synthase subunit D [Treponema sp. OMZ 791]UTC76076.1 V-type ATP synthase subunit D [Treponema sp. OMZ 792]UTC78053.1 V-type ATP synthase subunit D [Treponema sp. OMZ 799]